jgi:hypothetical protein
LELLVNFEQVDGNAATLGEKKFILPLTPVRLAKTTRKFR